MKRINALILMLVSFGLHAQESEQAFRRNKLALIIGHAHVPAGIDLEGKKAWTVLPSWGLDYDFRFNEKWSLGLHTDMVVESFEYEGEDEILYERTRPFLAVLSGGRRLGEHVTLLVGGGIELAKEENLKVVRVGLDYGWELPNEWEIGASLMSDFKIDAYNSWVLGLGVAKVF